MIHRPNPVEKWLFIFGGDLFEIFVFLSLSILAQLGRSRTHFGWWPGWCGGGRVGFSCCWPQGGSRSWEASKDIKPLQKVASGLSQKISSQWVCSKKFHNYLLDPTPSFKTSLDAYTFEMLICSSVLLHAFHQRSEYQGFHYFLMAHRLAVYIFLLKNQLKTER